MASWNEKERNYKAILDNYNNFYLQSFATYKC